MTRILASALGALIVGLIAGIAIGRTRTTTAPKTVVQKETPRSVLPSHEVKAEASDDPIVARQRAEIEKLTARVQELERRPHFGKPAQDKLAIAKEIYQCFLTMMKSTQEEGGIPRDYIKNVARLEELDESVTPFFLEKYRKAEGEEKELAMGLALCCGGREGATFVMELLENATLSEKERNSLLSALTTWGDNGLFPCKPLLVGPELAQKAFQLAESARDEERYAGIALLGQYDDASCRAKLQQFASSDSNPVVRSSAILALGRVGDRTTLAYLQSYAVPSDQPYLQQQIKGAIAKLKKKFPE